MPLAHVIDPARRLVYIRAWGPTTRADLIALRSSLVADPRFDKTYDVVADLRLADVSPLGTSDVQGLASSTAFATSSRRVIVADQDGTFGVARMFGTMSGVADNERIFVCRTLENGIRWLGVESFDPETFVTAD